MIQVIQIVTGGWAIFIGIVLLVCSLIIEKPQKENHHASVLKAMSDARENRRVSKLRSVPDPQKDHNTSMFRAVLLCIILYQLADMLAWQFSGKTALINTIMVRLSNLICFVSMPILLIVLCNYSYTLIKDVDQKKRFTFLLMRNIGGGVLLSMAVLNLFTGWLYYFDAQNIYQINNGYTIVIYYACGGFLLLRCHYIAWRYRKSRDASMLLRIRIACILNELACISQVLIFGYTVYNITLTAGAIIIFTGILRGRAEQQAQKQCQLEANRKDLARTRQQVLQLQIQPHFMYNTMAAIQAQVLENKDQAYESIGIFSSFLRDTIRFSTMDQLIPVEEELSFAEKYLELAELRFGDKLNIDFDIQETNFSVPAFTIQPLIENALNHGLKPFNHEGTIILRTYKISEGDRKMAILEVEDNGIGMNPSILKQLRLGNPGESEMQENEYSVKGLQEHTQPDNSLQENGHTNQRDRAKTHIGLFNVQQRLEMTCAGRLEAESPVKHQKATNNRAGTILRLIFPCSEETTL